MKYVIQFLFLINFIFAQDKVSWLLDDQSNILKLDSEKTQIFESEFKRMELSYQKLFEENIWSIDKQGYVNFKDPKVVYTFQPTWPDVLEKFGGYGGALDAGVTKDDLPSLKWQVKIKSLKFVSKNSVEINLIIFGEKSALEFHNIDNTTRKYDARYSLPKMNAQNK